MGDVLFWLLLVASLVLVSHRWWEPWVRALRAGTRKERGEDR